MTTELHRLVAQTLMGAFPGPRLPVWAARRLDQGLGGICLFGANAPDLETVAALTTAIHAAAPDAVVAIDEEGGDVTRLHYGVGSPHAGHAVLGAVDDVDVTARVAQEIGQQLHAAGIDLDLAPVADVNSTPLNPVIGVRSFGADAGLVARHTAAWVRGLQQSGVGACVKHFPGHGDTVTDSHVAMPVVEASEAVLRRRELVPFAAGVQAGAVAVMTTHVVLRAIDPTQPATFSPAAVALLRAPHDEGGLGFTGLLVSDALEMRAASGEIGLPAAAVRALVAGVDLLCLGARLDDALVQAVQDQVVAAIRDGTLAAQRLDEAAGRVATARRRLTTLRTLAAQPAQPAEPHMGTRASVEAARRGTTVLGALGTLTDPQVLRVVTDSNQAVGRVPWGLPGDGTVLRGRPVIDVHEDDPLPALDPHRSVVAIVRDGHRYAWVREALLSLARARPDLVVVEMGWPGPDRLPGRATILTHGASAVSADAVDAVLAGALS